AKRAAEERKLEDQKQNSQQFTGKGKGNSTPKSGKSKPGHAQLDGLMAVILHLRGYAIVAIVFYAHPSIGFNGPGSASHGSWRAAPTSAGVLCKSTSFSKLA
ncbi:unnamed protein product, partial [Prorocentrum cordatum]